jgi:hypothetical protein
VIAVERANRFGNRHGAFSRKPARCRREEQRRH